MMKIVSPVRFFELQQRMDTIAFNQTMQWFNTYPASMKSSAMFFTDSEIDPQICCFGLVSKKWIFGKKLIIEGLSYKKAVSSKTFLSFFGGFKHLEFDMITVSDIEVYNPDFEIGIRRAGFIRPLGLSLCPMSMMVDLTSPVSYHRNWKRNVSRSKESGNTFQIVEEPTRRDADDFVHLFMELKDRKDLSFCPDSDEIVPLFNGQYKLFFILDSHGKRISGRIEYENKGLIYDTYAANSLEAISTGAAYHIQECIFDYYKEQGAVRFDYGRIPPCDGPMDAIYLSKSYSGGVPFAYNGQWCYSSSLLLGYLNSFYRFFVHKSRLF